MGNATDQKNAQPSVDSQSNAQSAQDLDVLTPARVYVISLQRSIDSTENEPSSRVTTLPGTKIRFGQYPGH